jgi:hypothetical protein
LPGSDGSLRQRIEQLVPGLLDLNSFGITSRVFLDQLTPSGQLVSTLPVPDGSQPGPGRGGDGIVTSFSSKSELALNLSTSGRSVTFMGYVAKPGAIDVSNSNTPGVIDPTNPVPAAYYRVVAQVDGRGLTTTPY